jgi:hypothetical protein
VGNGGVFVLNALFVSTPNTATDINQLKTTLSGNARSQVSNRFMPAFRKMASIKDKRSKYF